MLLVIALVIAIIMSLSARMHLETQNRPLAQKQSDGVGNEVRNHVDP
jgi:hypothetical protein